MPYYETMENDGVAATEMDEAELQRQSWRPPDIEQDVKEMERRKRVEMIMNSQVFREELERIIESQLSEGYVPASLSALHQATQLLLPRGAPSGPINRTAIPINDIRGVDGLRYAKGEKLLRCKLAALYRLLDLYGWADSMANNITVRVSQDQEHFLVHPHGLQWGEVTASSLVKVDMQGNVIDPGSTTFSFSRPGFALHSALHASRPELRCVVHIHHTPCLAISATKCGLLPVSQEAALLGEVSYHECHGIPVERQEREDLARSLGPVSKVLVLRNRGVFACGESLEEALFLAQNIAGAAETQLRLMPMGLDNIRILSPEERTALRESVLGGQDRTNLPLEGGDEDKEHAETRERPKKWKVWDLHFEALMRMLDNALYLPCGLLPCGTSVVVCSQVFREELERIIESQLSEGYVPASLSALHQATQLLLPRGAPSGPINRTAIPINDIRGVDGLRYAKGEKLLRCKLASLYRLLDLYGWADSMANNITVRVSQDQEHFLVHPHGLQWGEVTASSLVKVDMQGNVIDPGSTTFSFSRPGFALHSALHASRPELRCVVHLHHTPCLAISATKCGLLPVSQEAALLGEVSYHECHGIPVERQEREDLARSLGPVSKVLVLRNRGVFACGESLEEALFLAQNIAGAAETQLRLMPMGLDNIRILSPEERTALRESVLGGQDRTNLPLEGGDEDKEHAETRERPKKWKVWDLHFEALMRMLDNAGYRTGYLYRQPLVRCDQPRAKTDVEVPPAASSFSQYFDSENKWLSPLKKLVEGRKLQDKMRWVNSPNVYQKVEVLETGTPDPKKITKWVQEGSPSHSTTVKIADALQFVPKSTDPQEFKRKQKEGLVKRLIPSTPYTSHDNHGGQLTT
ncbi:add-1 [Cordylochernes scorpioides]|uniref:Add-1 n=1 Tax=Cordylochernes scorpioides TaxID=51811 RepID=A0ABY6KJD1_9ARAC|nr:add-1 [Cordylochernes scorpioides]